MSTPEQLRKRAEECRKEACGLLCESALLLAEARLIERGNPHPNQEQIETEARGQTTHPVVEISREEFSRDAKKAMELANKAGTVYIVEDGKRVSAISVPKHPLGPGFDLESSEEIGWR